MNAFDLDRRDQREGKREREGGEKSWRQKRKEGKSEFTSTSKERGATKYIQRERLQEKKESKMSPRKAIHEDFPCDVSKILPP